ALVLPPAGPPSPQDLLAWWKLEGDGRDETGGGHDFTAVNTKTAPGRVGLGLAFDGTSCLRTPAWPAAALAGAPGVTMMAWVNVDVSFACPSSTPAILFEKGADYGMALQCTAPGSP